MAYQTAIQNQEALRLGSVLLEVGDSFGAMSNVGVIRDFSFAQQGESSEIPFDNGDGIERATDGDKFRAIFTLCEINWSNIAQLNSGQVNVTLNAGTAVTGATQTISETAWSLDQVYLLDGQNASGAAPTINAISASVDGALTVTTDYILVKDGSGRWGVMILSSGAAGTTGAAQDINITDYDYTPAANKTVTFNGSAIKSKKYFRITNTDDSGNTTVYRMSGSTNVVPMVLDFAGDDEADVATLPVEIEGTVVDFVDAQQTT